MGKRTILVAAATVLCFGGQLAAVLADAVADFEGTWIHLGDRYGFVTGHLEVVEISAEGAVDVRIYRNRSADVACEEAPESEACGNPKPTERGQMTIEPVTRSLRVADLQEVEPAYPHDIHQVSWQIVRFANDAHWSYARDGDVLRMSRSGDVDEYAFEMVKTYHRVDAAMPGDLHALVEVFQLRPTHVGCALDYILPKPELRAELRSLAAEAAYHLTGSQASRIGALAQWMNQNEHDRKALFPQAVYLLPEIEACLAEFN